MGKKKRTLKYIICILVMMCFLFINQTVLAADADPDTSAGEVDPNDYKPPSTTMVTGAMKLEAIGNNIIGVIQVIGTGSSVVALIIIGIKYMMGSVEEKAQYKETMKPYLIGAIMLFGITNILYIIQSVIANF